MKSIFTFALFALLIASATEVRADRIIILKCVEAVSDQFYNEDNPINDAFGNNADGAIAPTGYAVYSSNYSYSRYLIINLTSSEVTPVYYYTSPSYPGYPGTKQMWFEETSNLSNYFDPVVPLKTPKSFLWNYQRSYGGYYDPTLDGYGSTSSEFAKGIGSPLVVNSTLTIPNVPSSITGKRNETSLQDWDASTYMDENDDEIIVPPYRSFSKSLTTITMTLDAAVTKACNVTAINGTADLGYSGALAAGTIENASQRVRNLLYALGYRMYDIE